MKIIGIGGKKSTGKTQISFDYVSYKLHGKLWNGEMPLSFEDKTRMVAIRPLAFELKSMVCKVFGLNMSEMEKDKTKVTHLTSPITNETNITYRTLLQHYGTEIFRKTDQDIWVRLLDEWARKERVRYLILNDVRFENEIEYCKQDGVFIYLKGRGEIGDTHASESIDGEKFADAVVDNSNLSRQQQLEELDYELKSLGIDIRV